MATAMTRRLSLPALALALLTATCSLACGAAPDEETDESAAASSDGDDQGVKPDDVADETLGTTSSAESADDELDAADDGEEPAVAPAARAPKPIEVVFNDPTRAPENRAIEKSLEELIALAPAGSSIRLSMYGFTRHSPAKALVKAHERGVDVKLVLDGQNAGNSAVTYLKAHLPDANITLCKRGRGSCIGNGINHNKFVIFSALADGSKHVVWQASQNLTRHQLDVHNNAVIVRGDTTLYAGYASYFGDLERHKENLDYYDVVDGSRARAYFFPRAAGDTVLGILDNVRCQKNKSTIRVAMAFFVDGRLSVAKKLGALKRAGCSVEVLLNADDAHEGSAVVATLAKAKVNVREYDKKRGAAGIHSKYLLIDSKYDGAKVEHRRLVFTGSHNYTASALRNNDETLLRVDDRATFDAFSADYANIRKLTR
ncbi:MAG: hypothetical protein JWP97_6174 [Labilithrix sp.]|nr:hypothetical protein [Labilithrix sp.]